MRRLPFPVALALVLVLGVACGSGGAGGGSGTGDGPMATIRGKVTSGPQCPVIVAGSPCPDRPWTGTVEVRTPAGATVVSAETTADGSFSVAVAPGTYDVVALTQGMGPASSKPTRVSASAGATTSVRLTVDTGIR
jgi:hypothetical protein